MDGCGTGRDVVPGGGFAVSPVDADLVSGLVLAQAEDQVGSVHAQVGDIGAPPLGLGSSAQVQLYLGPEAGGVGSLQFEDQAVVFGWWFGFAAVTVGLG